MSGTGPASLTVRSRHLRQRAPSPNGSLARHPWGWAHSADGSSSDAGHVHSPAYKLEQFDLQ